MTRNHAFPYYTKPVGDMSVLTASRLSFFDPAGRLVFAPATASERQFAHSTAVVLDSRFEPIFPARQSPASAFLAAIAIVLFGVVAAGSTLFATVHDATSQLTLATAAGLSEIASHESAIAIAAVSASQTRIWGTATAPHASVTDLGTALARASAQPYRLPFAREITSSPRVGDSLMASVVVAAQAALLLTPGDVSSALSSSYTHAGALAYGWIRGMQYAYLALIAQAGERAYTLGGFAVRALSAAPGLAVNTAFAADALLAGASHAIIGSEVSLVYAFVNASPRVAFATVALVGNTGALLALGTEHLPQLAMWTVTQPSILGPALSAAVTIPVYNAAGHFVLAVHSVQTSYLALLLTTGEKAYDATVFAEHTAQFALGPGREAAQQNMYNAYHASTALTASVYAAARTIVTAPGETP